MRTLILGGARSGKSRHAESLAASHTGPVVYLATACAEDAEMAERIARHRASRPAAWKTLEVPLVLPEALREQDRPDRFLLVDCLTLWLSNLLLEAPDDAVVEARIEALVAAVEGLSANTALVANEVGLGIVPDNALARRFRDHAGRLHQALAGVCERVVLMVAGLPMTVKEEIA